MRNWLLTAPWWALSLFAGGVYALGMTLAGRYLEAESWAEAVVSGVLVGVFFGAVMGPFAARMNRRLREAAGGLPADQLFRAVKLARRGAVPEDPELRRGARRVALQQREQLVRQRWWALPFFSLLLVLAVWQALTGSPSGFWWLTAAFMVALLLAHLLMARHLDRRAAMLADPPGEQLDP